MLSGTCNSTLFHHNWGVERCVVSLGQNSPMYSCYIHLLPTGVQAWMCAEVNTSASVVAVGSSISASCHINNHCPLTKGKEFRVEWKINNHLVPSNLTYMERNGTYAVFIPHILDQSADITCRVCAETNCQIVGGSLVKVEREKLLKLWLITNVINKYNHSTHLFHLTGCMLFLQLL